MHVTAALRHSVFGFSSIAILSLMLHVVDGADFAGSELEVFGFFSSLALLSSKLVDGVDFAGLYLARLMYPETMAWYRWISCILIQKWFWTSVVYPTQKLLD